MATIHIERKHRLGLDVAKGQVAEIARHLKQELQADYQWKGDVLHFARSGASGTITVGENTIVLDAKLGLALGLMKARIEQTIDRELDRALAASNSNRTA